jgi:hypothetical protein
MAKRGQMEGQTRCSTGATWGGGRGPDGGPDGPRRGGGRKDYLLLKEKMTCFVYVSCKSSLAFDVSDAGWM